VDKNNIIEVRRQTPRARTTAKIRNKKKGVRTRTRDDGQDKDQDKEKREGCVCTQKFAAQPLLSNGT
jgi:hypothetical protein